MYVPIENADLFDAAFLLKVLGCYSYSVEHAEPLHFGLLSMMPWRSHRCEHCFTLSALYYCITCFDGSPSGHEGALVSPAVDEHIILQVVRFDAVLLQDLDSLISKFVFVIPRSLHLIDHCLGVHSSDMVEVSEGAPYLRTSI
jgi:hypothetical protein